MAVGINSVWECRASATAANLNGALFNPERTATLTDLTTDSNTANTASPVCSSASYNFAASDVNAYLFVQSGTNWTPGWYKVASVASNKATLSAAIGAAVQYTSGAARSFTLNTVVGCATTGTPTSGSFMIDYSQQDTAIINGSTDFTAVGSSTTLTSVTGGFTKAMVGNGFHQTTTGTGAFGVVGWYEITVVTDGNTVTLDRTPNSGTASVACTGYVGGAASLSSSSGATDDAFFENGLGTNGSGAHVFFIKNGSYTAMGAVAIAAAGGTRAPINIYGYNTLRTDGITSILEANRPTLTFGANAFSLGADWNIQNCIVSGTTSNQLATGNSGRVTFSKAVCSSTTAARNAFSFGTATNCSAFGCEFISYRGRGISIGQVSSTLDSCYIHDCDIGYQNATTAGFTVLRNCIIASNVTTAINFTAASAGFNNIETCTIYGSESKMGTAMNLTTGTTNFIFVDNIIYGFVTGVTHADVQTISYDNYNDYFNNTTDVSNWPKGPADIALNPTFTNVAEYTQQGTVSTSGSVLTDTTANFANVADNVDFLYVTGGGTTAGKYLITAHTTTTVTTDSALGTHSGAITYVIAYGHNYAVGTNVKAVGYPGVFPAGFTTGYLDLGAAQRQDAGSAGMLFIPNLEGT